MSEESPPKYSELNACGRQSEAVCAWNVLAEAADFHSDRFL